MINSGLISDLPFDSCRRRDCHSQNANFQPAFFMVQPLYLYYDWKPYFDSCAFCRRVTPCFLICCLDSWWLWFFDVMHIVSLVIRDSQRDHSFKWSTLMSQKYAWVNINRKTRHDFNVVGRQFLIQILHCPSVLGRLSSSSCSGVANIHSYRFLSIYTVRPDLHFKTY